MHVKSEHLYQLLLNPQGFVQYLYTRDPSYTCGITFNDEFNPFSQYISSRVERITGKRGSVYISDGVTSFHGWTAPFTKITGINPPWVRRFNSSLRRLGGGEPETDIWPTSARDYLAAALDVKLPRSPFDGANVSWPGYDEDEDKPWERPYDMTSVVNDWQLTKVGEGIEKGFRWVQMTFRTREYKKLFVFKVPEFFPLHFGFENRTGEWVEEIKITDGWDDRQKQYIITFYRGAKLAIPLPVAILDENSKREDYAGIPF